MEHSKLNKTGTILLLMNVFIYLTLSLYTPYLTSYYSKAGLDALEIGVLVTIGPLTAIFIQPIWAILSDRSGKRKLILILVILGSALSIYTYYIGKSFLTFFIASLLLAMFSTSVIPLSDAIVLRIAHKYNFDFSRIRLGGTIGYACMVIISGAIVKQQPAMQFLLGSIGYFLLLFVVLLLPSKECHVQKDQKRSPALHHGGKERVRLLNIFESKQIYFLLAFAFIGQVGLSFNFTFMGVYMTKLGLGEGTIGFVSSISAFSEIPVLFLINRMLKKRSAMQLTITACFFLVFRILLITGESLGFIILSNLVHGITFMTIYYSCATYISRNVKPEYQSQGQSILTIVQTGIGSITGNILGGFLVDQFGLKHSYQFMSLIIASITFLLMLFNTLYQRKANNHIQP